MDILYMQYTIIGVKKELLRLSLRLAQEFDLLNMRMASMLLPSHFPLLSINDEDDQGNECNCLNYTHSPSDVIPANRHSLVSHWAE